MKKKSKKIKKSKKTDEKGLQDLNHENFKFLVGNEVRFAIVSTMSILNQPLNLTKLSKLTGYPTTTLIHHIPSMLERDLIINSGEPTTKKKFYSLGPNYFKIKEFNDSEADIEKNLSPLLHAEDMDITDYKFTLLKFFGDMVQSKRFDESISDSMVTLAMFNKTQASVTSELWKKMKKIVIDFKEKEKVNLDFPITIPSMGQSSYNFSTIKQLNEFQAIYIKFLKDLSNFKKKIDQENKGLDENKLEKAYFYLFVAPIFNIND